MILSKLNLVMTFPGVPKDISVLSYILPDEVIQEILTSHKCQTLVEVVDPKNNIIVADPPQREDWASVAFFMNKNVKWKVSNLKIAFNWYLKHTNKTQYMKSPFDITDYIGLPDDSHPETLTPIMLYGYCLHNKITVSKKVSSQEMLKCLEYFFGVRPTYCLIEIDTPLPASFYARMSLLLQEYGFTADDEIPFDLELADTKKIDEMIESKKIPDQINTDEDAIVAALLKYNINLFESDYPMREYLKMNNHYKKYHTFDNYCPITKHWSNWQSIYFSETMSPNIEICFGPNVSRHAYKIETLRKHAEAFGIIVNNEMSRDEIYDLLLISHTEDTFYPGKIREIDAYNTTNASVTLNNLENLSSDDIVCYGIWDNEMIVLEWETINTHFKLSQNFYNPADEKNTIFSAQNIRRLKYLAKKYYQPLYITINDILDKHKKDTEAYGNWLKLYGKHDLTYDIIYELHKLAMTCRGWQGEPEDLPVGNKTVYHESSIDEPVARSLIRLYELLEKCSDDMKQSFLNLPTFNYENGKYKSSNTISARLKFIQDPNDEQLACTRLNSNYFAVTSYILAEQYGKPLPYDIRNFRQADPQENL